MIRGDRGRSLDTAGMRVPRVIWACSSKLFNPFVSLAINEIIGERIRVSDISEAMTHPQETLTRVYPARSTVSFLWGIGTLG